MFDCVFCKLLAGEVPASIVFEDDNTVAFMDLRQTVPGHVLVVPRRHAPTIYDLAPEEGAAVMHTAMRVAQTLRRAFDPAGLNLWQSNGEVAGQEVEHFHLHVHPRRHGDGLSAYQGDPPRPSSRGELDALAATLRKHI